MPNRRRLSRLSSIVLGLSAGTALAQDQGDALASWYAQQATQVRALVEQLGSSDPDRQRFALWQLELELAIPQGSEAQPMLEEAAARGVLPTLEDLMSASDPELSTSAADLHASIVEALGLSAMPTQVLPILDGVTSEALGPEQQASWLSLALEAGKEYRVRAAGCDLVSALVVSANDLSVVDGGFAVNRNFSFTSSRDESVLMRVRPSNCTMAGMINVSFGAPLRSIAGSATATEAMPVTAGRFVGRLAENGQQWLSLNVPAGASFEIVADPQASDLDTYLTVFDSTGWQRLAEDDDGGTGLGSRLVYTSTEGRDVLIEVSRLGSSWGEYELTIAEAVPPSERGREVELGVVYNGDLSFDAREWWRFTPSAGKRYRIEAEPNDSSLDTYLNVYEIDGTTLIGEDDDGGIGLGSRLDFTRPSDSPVLIEVLSLNDQKGTYRLTMSESQLSFDHAEHAVDAGTYRGRVGDNGESFWRLATPAGRYRVEVAPFAGLDSVITLYDADGATELDYDDDGGQGFGSRLEFVATGATTHVLSVGSFGGAGDFELVFSALPGPAELAETAEQGGVYRSGIRYGDEQWWRIDTVAGAIYDFEALPRDGLDTVMALYAADGVTLIDQDDDSGQGLGSRIRYPAVSDEPVFISVTGLNGSIGEFQLFVR